MEDGPAIRPTMGTMCWRFEWERCLVGNPLGHSGAADALRALVVRRGHRCRRRRPPGIRELAAMRAVTSCAILSAIIGVEPAAALSARPPWSRDLRRARSSPVTRSARQLGTALGHPLDAGVQLAAAPPLRTSLPSFRRESMSSHRRDPRDTRADSQNRRC